MWARRARAPGSDHARICRVGARGDGVDARTHCLLAGDLAAGSGSGEAVRDALLQVFERWDGKGDPGVLAGSAISQPVRLVQLADVVEVFHRQGGVEAAVAVARERSGTQFDPRWSSASVTGPASCWRRLRIRPAGMR